MKMALIQCMAAMPILALDFVGTIVAQDEKTSWSEDDKAGIATSP
jgi:hypothetical protein